MLSLLQCFSLYVAVLGAHYSEKSKDLLAYQALMIRCVWTGAGFSMILPSTSKSQISGRQIFGDLPHGGREWS